MTTPQLIEDLKRDEGFRARAYQDQGGVWTIGYGHTPAEPGWAWEEGQAEAQLAVDLFQKEEQLDAQVPWWRTLNDARQDGLANMAFNLGVVGLLKFQHILAALEAGDWTTASAQALLSQWAKDPPVGVGARAARIAALFRTGVRP